MIRRLSWCLLLGLTQPLSAQETAPAFRTSRFDFPSAVQAVFADDLDGDGRKELIFQHDRTLEIVPPSERGYSAARSTEATLPAEAFLWDFAEMDGMPGLDLVFLTGQGASMIPRAEGGYSGPLVMLVEEPTLFTGALTEPPRRKSFQADLDADGDADLLLPVPAGFAVYAQTGPGRFTRRQLLGAPIEATVDTEAGLQNPVRQGVSLPRFHLGELTGDGRTDVLFVELDRLRVFPQAEDGSFPAEPLATFLMGSDLKASRRKRRFEWPIPPELLDINADGIVDLVFSDSGRGTTTLFLGRPDTNTYDKPTEIKRFDGWILMQQLLDLDGDRRLDLILVRMPKLGIGEALQILLTRTVDLEIAVFLDRPDGTFGDVPAHRRSIEAPLVFSVSNTAVKIESPYILNFEGDFTRDGRKDLLVKQSDDTLSVYAGRDGKDLFGKKELFSLKTIDTRAYASTAVTVDDLNADGVSDVILHHRDIAAKAHVIEVFLSR